MQVTSLLVTALALSGFPVLAGPCNIGQVQSFIDLGSTGCTAGAFTFYNFGFSQSKTGGASLPPLDSITIDPLVNDSTIGPVANSTGMLILGNWNAAAGQSVMYSLSFSVELTQGGNLKGVLDLGYTSLQYPAMIPRGDTWGTTTVLGYNAGQITGQNLFTYSFDGVGAFGGGFYQPLVAGIYDPILNKTYDLSHTPFLNIEETKILKSTSGNVQDLGTWNGIGPSIETPEPRYLPLIGLSLLVFLLRRRTLGSPTVSWNLPGRHPASMAILAQAGIGTERIRSIAE